MSFKTIIRLEKFIPYFGGDGVTPRDYSIDLCSTLTVYGGF
jgi:hypothetical protein